MLPTQATLTTEMSFLFNTCQDQKRSVKSYSYPVSHTDIQRATGTASLLLTVTLDGHTHIGQWVGPANGQGALNKKKHRLSPTGNQAPDRPDHIQSLYSDTSANE